MRISREVLKTTGRRGLAALVILCAIATTSTIASAKPIQRLSDAERERLCGRALEEVETSRAYIADLEARLATARKQLAAEEEKGALEAKERALQDERVRLLGEQVTLLEKSVEIAKDGLTRAEEDLARVRAERDKARGRLKWAAVLGAVGGAIVTVLAIGAAGGGS